MVNDTVAAWKAVRSGTTAFTNPGGVSGTISWTASTDTSTAVTLKPYKPGCQFQWCDLEEAWYDGAACGHESSLCLRKSNIYELPDGAQLKIDDKGNYQIDDSDAKVIYQANRIRNFSPHLNASDMLAEFVKYVGTLGVRRADVLNLPLHLFVSWLVIEAAERDGDEIPEDIIPVSQDRAVTLAKRPQCLSCGRFIKRLHYSNNFPYCSPEHALRRLPA